MVKVSVIVPVYNVSAYLPICLFSLMNQTLKDIEFIIVDDGSTDDSFNVAKKLTKDDKRFHLYHKTNGGLSDARNYGITKANGEYLTFIDSDDYVDHNMMEEMYLKAKKTNADIVECDFIWEYSDKQIIDKSILKESDNIMLDIRVLACNKLYRTDLIKKLNISFLKGYRYEDVAFCYKYLPFINKIETINKPFYHYIQRNGSIANTQNAKVRDIFIELDEVLNYYHDKKIYDKYKNELEYLYMRYILGSHFLRTIQIKDKKLRNSILKESYDKLNETFPNWRKNKYLKRKGLKNKYYRMMNPIFYNISSKIFRIIKR